MIAGAQKSSKVDKCPHSPCPPKINIALKYMLGLWGMTPKQNGFMPTENHCERLAQDN